MKKELQKTWNFLWHDDSLLSWVVFLIVIFVFIKFIFFPVLSLIFGTALPIVIVESCSMHHGEDLDDWWGGNEDWYASKDIGRNEFGNFPLVNGFTKGDIFFVTGVSGDEVEVGDVIIFSDSQSLRPIIHRVVSLNPLQTKGDNNPGQIPFEMDINLDNIVGRATNVKIPLIGWLKLIFFEPFRKNGDRGFCS
jgi:signal peptidase I